MASRDAHDILKHLDGAVVDGAVVTVLMANKEAIALVLGGVRGYAVRRENNERTEREVHDATPVSGARGLLTLFPISALRRRGRRRRRA